MKLGREDLGGVREGKEYDDNILFEKKMYASIHNIGSVDCLPFIVCRDNAAKLSPGRHASTVYIFKHHVIMCFVCVLILLGV